MYDAHVPRPFLTARWSNLCILTYAVPRSLLEPHLPPGLSLDARDGRCFASLVAFDFLDTRIRGRRIPGHVNFPEVNLRFYVRDGLDRGVCFVREFVPRRAICWVAQAFYNEPYSPARMSSRIEHEAERIVVRHRFSRGAAVGELQVTGTGSPQIPPPDSPEHFFKEHSWGFGTSRRGALLRYRVAHPVWAIYRVEAFECRVDWASLYGPQWTQLGRPVSVVLAEGSPVEVYPQGASPGDE